MIRKNKGKLVASTLLMLLPLAAGMVLWDRLPERVAIHWGADGSADGWADRFVAVVVLPLVLLALHWFCILVTAKDPRNREQNQKVMGLIFWICPIVSLFCGVLVYGTALGWIAPVTQMGVLLLALMFVVVGNYLPKCKQNHTIGIKVPWALNDEANWNATHRLAGKLWVIGGLLLLPCVLLPDWWSVIVVMTILSIAVIVPVIYSYWYFRRNTNSPKTDE